jgi:hypothetical protein
VEAHHKEQYKGRTMMSALNATADTAIEMNML